MGLPKNFTLSSLPERISRLLSSNEKEPSLITGLVERDEQMKLMLLAALAGEHALLIGPPGTAKSLLARRLRLAFKDAIYFERLLTQFSVPEDLFGPYRLSELEHDNFVRKTANYLPGADIAFLDEIFKSNPAILNALLTILHERMFHNDTADPKIPLKCLIGASNEVPEPGELDALYDRFLVRCEAGYVRDVRQLLRSGSDDEPDIPVELKFTPDNLTAIRKAAREVTVPDSVDALLELLRNRAMETQLPVSDRRWLKIRRFLQTAALTCGRQAVSPLDVLLVPHCIWSPRPAEPLAPTKPAGKATVPPTPAELRDAQTQWLQERLWEATPARAGLLGEQLAVWETKLKQLDQQTTAKRNPGDIASGLKETKALQQRVETALTGLTSESQALKKPVLWLSPEVSQTALRRLAETQAATADWKSRVDQVVKNYEQLQKNAAAQIKLQPVAVKPAGTATRPASTKRPDPYDFGHSPAEAMKIAPQVQQDWAAYLAGNPAMNSSRQREVTQSFQKNKYATPWTMDFLLIPPGEFITEGTKRQIAQPFLLGQYHVTREQWEAAAVGPAPWHKAWSGKNLPVDSVSWLMCIEFCNRLSEIQGLQVVYSGSAPNYKFNEKANGYRLPTEWEWEYACRAGTATQWWCGDSEEELKKVAWFDKNSGQRTHPVDERKAPNPFGLTGMHGNLWEWCWDAYDSTRRVLRGGSWNYFSGILASGCRNCDTPDDTDGSYGCRVSRTVFLDA